MTFCEAVIAGVSVCGNVRDDEICSDCEEVPVLDAFCVAVIVVEFPCRVSDPVTFSECDRVTGTVCVGGSGCVSVPFGETVDEPSVGDRDRERDGDFVSLEDVDIVSVTLGVSVAGRVSELVRVFEPLPDSDGVKVVNVGVGALTVATVQFG